MEDDGNTESKMFCHHEHHSRPVNRAIDTDLHARMEQISH
jgi:hypothetical protein